MAIGETSSLRTAQDGYDAYYAEKIWRLIPAIYRDEDPKSASPDALRALVDVLGEAVADSRRSVDRLWADSSIEDCDDWAIPYIGELFGTRLISEQNTAGRRADVANTIKYRRMAGTVALLAMLADDIAGWDAVPQEAFKRLFRNWHSLDCPAPIGPISATPQHGLARLTHARVGDTAYGPFDDVAHLPDFRQLRGRDGRYNTPKVNLHIFRQSAFELNNVTPHSFGGGRYTLDPSGRDCPLFIPGQPANDGCKTGEEWQLRQPLSCRLYNDGRYDLSRAALDTVGLAALTPLEGQSFRTAAALIDRALGLKQQATNNPAARLTLAEGQALMTAPLTETSNRGQLVADGVIDLALGPVPTPSLDAAALVAGNLADWITDVPTTETWVETLVDPANGRALTEGAEADLHSRRFYEGRFWPVGAGTHERSAGLLTQATDWAAPGAVDAGPHLPVTTFTLPTTGTRQIADSRTYLHSPNTDLTLTGDLHLQARNGERPYIRLESATVDGARRFVINGPDGAHITLDGLWFGMIAEGQTEENVAGAAPMACDIVLAGDFGSVTLRNMTLDPGGRRAQVTANQVFMLPFVRLRIEGGIDQIILDRCVTGPIEEALDAFGHCSGTRVCMFDSILRGRRATPAFLGRNLFLEMARCTVIGDISAARYLIEDSLIEGTVQALDQQGSCFRYSAAHETEAIGLAGAYRSVGFADGLPRNTFLSRRFGDPDFVQLSETVPDAIRRGAENTSEMGANNSALDPIKRDDLVYKLSEFTTINTITQLVFET
ncbi:hypothetical protein [Shimia sp. Alg240-R146]|uniref:hypothetical protein n=1 Tax=Shimia sp. Alg240-R146 TaxID=2993449 RepID=UPI0022E0B0A2|nr:hypothetical protein [Shimia sp. Alg240-R146]